MWCYQVILDKEASLTNPLTNRVMFLICAVQVQSQGDIALQTQWTSWLQLGKALHTRAPAVDRGYSIAHSGKQVRTAGLDGKADAESHAHENTALNSANKLIFPNGQCRNTKLQMVGKADSLWTLRMRYALLLRLKTGETKLPPKSATSKEEKKIELMERDYEDTAGSAR